MAVQWARGILVSFCLIMSAVVGTALFITPILWLRLVSFKAFQAITRPVINAFTMYSAILCHDIIGYKMRVTCDLPAHGAFDRSENAIIVMNHRSQLDIPLFMEIHYLRGDFQTATRIVVKNTLMRVPGLGWAMRLVGYGFLARMWERDQRLLEECVQATTVCGDYPGWIILYAEGTTLQKYSKAKNKEYMEKQGLKPFEYCLMPRTRGFTHLVRQFDTPPAIYDWTLGYPVLRKTSRRPQPIDMVNGNWPETHIHMRRYAPEEYPAEGSDDELSAWLQQLWTQKEERLRNFYENPATVDMPQGSFPGKVLEYQPPSFLYRAFVFVSWTFITFGQFYWLYSSSYFRWWYSFSAVYHTVDTYLKSRVRSRKYK